MYHILLDEVQMLDEFEEVLVNVQHDQNGITIISVFDFLLNENSLEM